MVCNFRKIIKRRGQEHAATVILVKKALESWPYLCDVFQSHLTKVKQKLTERFDDDLFCLIPFVICQTVQ